MLIATGRISWSLFEEIVMRRRIVVPVAFALRYLVDELRVAIPGDTVERLTRASFAQPFLYLSGILHARPRYRATKLGDLVRSGAGRLRRRAERRQMPRREKDRRLQARALGRWKGGSLPPAVTQHRFDLPQRSEIPGPLRLRGVVHLTTPKTRRRIELEVNGGEQHVCRIRYRKLFSRRKPFLLQFEGIIDPPIGETQLVLEARPSRQTRDDPSRKDRYGLIPFQLVFLEIDEVPSGGAAAERDRARS